MRIAITSLIALSLFLVATVSYAAIDPDAIPYKVNDKVTFHIKVEGDGAKYWIKNTTDDVTLALVIGETKEAKWDPISLAASLIVKFLGSRFSALRKGEKTQIKELKPGEDHLVFDAKNRNQNINIGITHIKGPADRMESYFDSFNCGLYRSMVYGWSTKGWIGSCKLEENPK